MTHMNQDSELPALPLPSLEESGDLAQELMKPLLDPEVFLETHKALQDFQRPGGVGKSLQEALSAHKNSLPGNASWLRPLWDDAYLSWREALPINMNYAFCLDARHWGQENALPSLLQALGLLFRHMGLGILKPERASKGFLSMDQTQSCVYTRLPLLGCDALYPVPLAGALHIAVTRNGHWYILQLCNAAGSFASRAEIHRALHQIRSEADHTTSPAITTFSAAPRAEAAATRAELLTNPLNRQNLRALESAVLVLCLDETHSSDEELNTRLLCGPAGHRFYDKSLQLIATDNGGLGANLEHTGCDAGIWLYILQLADSILTEQGTDQARGLNPPPRRLEWQVSAALNARLEKHAQDFAEVAKGLSLHPAIFPEFSRNAIKALGTSPDAFLQISFQAAQYQLFGKLKSSYESVSMRSFAQGRTEVCRASTAEAGRFAAALATGADRGILRDLYRQAEAAHLLRLERAQQGRGAERHFAGLQCMYTMYGPALGLTEAPAIFSDPGWLTLKHDSLSTSSVGAPFIRYFGFGPVVGDGLGLGYSPAANSTNVLISGYNGSSPAPRAFRAAFETVAGSLAAILK